MTDCTQNLTIPALYNVKGKIVLITGGGSGIGKMLAAGFSQNGAKVYISSRKEKQLQEAIADLQTTASEKIDYIVGNVGSKSGCNAIIAEFKKRESKLHVLVNNSGIIWGDSYNDFNEEKGWDNVFNVNLKAIFYRTNCGVYYPRTQTSAFDPGRVINISSTASVDPQAETALNPEGTGSWSYLASKAAMNHLTSSLALKLAPNHVTVNAILPGIFPKSKMVNYGIRTAGLEEFSASQPTGRYGYPQDIAGLTLFLASPASSHITGVQIIIDGGSRYNARRPRPRVKL